MTGIKLLVRGRNACFTRPEMKVERVTYDVIAPSAATNNNIREHVSLSCLVYPLMQHRGTIIENTFAEAFRMWAARLIVTAVDDHWLDVAARETCGYATSVIGCDAETAIEHIDPIVMGLPVGTWRGQWASSTDSEAGDWELVMTDDPSLRVEGCVRSDDGWVSPLSCTVSGDTAGGADLSGDCMTLGVEWQGAFERNGVATGVWDAGFEEEGTFGGGFAGLSTEPVSCEPPSGCGPPCEIWDACTEGGYSFDECAFECSLEGGWGSGYTACLQNSTCEEILTGACE